MSLEESLNEVDSILEHQATSIQRITAALEQLRSSKRVDPLDRLEDELIEANISWGAAYVRCGLERLDDVKSLVHDILTGANDVWAKTQLLEAIGVAEAMFRKSL